MKNIKVGTILLLFITLISIQTQNYTVKSEEYEPISLRNLTNKISQETFYKVDIQITSPEGHSMPGFTPIAINLSVLASGFPISADPFGTTSNDTSDDIKWPAAYVVYDNSLIPSQVDDIDGKTGFSEGDELVFQFPEELTLESEESATFSVFFGTQESDLPEPYFDDVCKIYDYPDYDTVAENHGTDMLAEVYNMENGIIRASPMVDAAWSSGGLYHLQVLDEEGNSQWDATKQGFLEEWESWKWARFATVEQFVALNDKAGTNPFFLPDSRNSLIQGPVRARIQMKSLAPYGKSGTVYGTKPGVFGLVTYELYANQNYLDYTLDTTGPNADQFPTLQIEIQNREKAAGGAYSPYKWIYVPGKGYLERTPSGSELKANAVQASEMTQSWYLEKLKPGEEMSPPPSPPDADKLGLGFLFDKTGLKNISFGIPVGTNEYVKLDYGAAEMPLQTRYYPIDASITTDAIAFMSEQYDLWSRPSPDYSISVTETTELPFDYISVTRPELTPSWAKIGDTLTISNVSAIASTIGEIRGNTTGTTHVYDIIWENTSEIILTGELEWDTNTSLWGATDIDISSLTSNEFYYVRVRFTFNELSGASKLSKKFWYGNSDPPIDLTPPTISGIIQTPMTEAIVRSTDTVNVSCLATDESGISSVFLSYFNGSWYNTEMIFDAGTYTGSIPPYSPGKTVQYKITATDDSDQQNSNTTEIFTYVIALEYQPGQGIIPLIGISGILIAAVIVAKLLTGMHKQKYDQV